VADELEPNPKISRRTAIRSGAVIGAGVWAVPTISSMRLPAHAQVGSPMPEPTPTETETTAPTPTPTPRVGGVKIVDGSDVGGAGLAKTGQNLGAHAIAGGGLVALGLGMKRIAGNRLSEQLPAEDPPKSG